MEGKPMQNRIGQQKKMGNTPSVCARGHSHRSKLESAVCQMIHLMEAAGEVKLLQVEDHIYLTKARIGYIPDFKCQSLKSGEIYWIEAKGFQNDRWPTKKKLWKFYGPGPLHIYKGTYQRIYLDEVVTPQKEITMSDPLEAAHEAAQKELKDLRVLLGILQEECMALRAELSNYRIADSVSSNPPVDKL